MSLVKKKTLSITKKGGGLSALREEVKRSEIVAHIPVQETLIVCLDESYSMKDSITRVRGHTSLYSGRSGKTKIAAMRSAAQELVMSTTGASEMGIIGFSSRIRVICEPTRERKSLRDAVNSIEPTGQTNIRDALLKSGQFLSDSKSRVKRVILMTDGNETSQDTLRSSGGLRGMTEIADHPWLERHGLLGAHSFELPSREMADLFSKEGWIIDTVAFGYDADMHLLDMLSTKTGGVKKSAKDASELIKAFKSLEAGTRGLLTQGDER